MEFWHYDVEKIAINAVMAGCAPEQLPVLLAIGQGGDTGRQSSMSSMGNMVVVNGPIRHEIGMNSGIGALGPYNYANAVIGRGFGIMSQNLQGGSVPGLTYNGSQGCNFSYNCITYAENEERSPWEPYHVEHGFSADESAVTVSYIWGNVWSEYLREYWEEKLVAMVSGLEPGMGCTIVLDPIVAREFVEKGFDTKAKIAEWIHENAKIPRRRYWDHVMLARRGGGRAVLRLLARRPRGTDSRVRDEPDQRRGRRRRNQRPLQHLHGFADAREVPGDRGRANRLDAWR
jgi:hypothetical protein